MVVPDLVITFAISGTSLGILASGYFYSYAIMQIPVGLLSDSWGTRKTVALFSLVAALGSVLFALAPSFGVATFARVLVGLGVSATFVSSLKVLAEWFSGREYARISGLLMAMGGIGWLSAATPLAFLAEAFGWRSAFVIVGAITVVLGILTWFLVIDRPESEDTAAVNIGYPSTKNRNLRLLSGLSEVFGKKYFWVIAIWLFFAQGTLFSFFGLWAGPYLMDTYALSKPSAGNILSMIAVGMVVGGPFLGHLSDRILESRKKMLVGASAVNVFVWCIMIVFYHTFSLPALFGIFFLMGVTTSSIVVIVFTSVKELFPLEMAGTAIGTANLFGFFGGIVFQPLIGYVLDIAGKVQGAYPPYAYRWAFWVFLAMNTVSLMSIIFSTETIRK
ncbi:MAG: transporter [Deltaproteobacteria bacterium]|nr:transporter [Deltaproteobacteria bacterium]